MSNTGLDLFAKAQKLIPGGVQLFSKNPQATSPGAWPSYYSQASGSYIRDLAGEEYLDMSHCGVGACPLGYNDPDVNAAVIAAVNRGSSCSLNNPEEVELAELLCNIHPWADMVRYTRGGGEAMAVAVRIARAATGKSGVITAGYHGWHDWYLAGKKCPEKFRAYDSFVGTNFDGIPDELAGTAIPFKFGDVTSMSRAVEASFKGSHNNLAAIVIDTSRDMLKDVQIKEFLEAANLLAQSYNAVLIYDEVSGGFRGNFGRHQNKDGTWRSPDIAVFGKAISNGFAFGAVIGRREVMEAANNTFISSTYWTESLGPAAALATIKKLHHEHVSGALNRRGIVFTNRVEGEFLARKGSLPINIEFHGIWPLRRFLFVPTNPDPGINPEAYATLFTEMMLRRGILATNQFYPMLTHTNKHIEQYCRALRDFCRVISGNPPAGIPGLLHGPVRLSHPVRRN